MSWDASLVVSEVVDCPTCGKPGHTTLTEVCDVNYTHNTSKMIYAVLDDAGVVLPVSTRPCRAYDRETGVWTDYPNGHGTIPWWEHLDGMTATQGADYLGVIIAGLAAEPGRFRAMNPENGWGDYDSLLGVLREMRQATQEHPEGEWQASG